MQDLIRRCWLPKPEDRPSFDDILTEFHNVGFRLGPNVDDSKVHAYVSKIRASE
jgi:hypothetical protein